MILWAEQPKRAMCAAIPSCCRWNYIKALVACTAAAVAFGPTQRCYIGETRSCTDSSVAAIWSKHQKHMDYVTTISMMTLRRAGQQRSRQYDRYDQVRVCACGSQAGTCKIAVPKPGSVGLWQTTYEIQIIIDGAACSRGA